MDGNGQTALHSGAWGGSLECCQALLRAGADPKAIDVVGRTPLHWAAERGHKAVAELLLAAGSEVDAMDANGRTPLHLAANLGHSRVSPHFEALSNSLVQRFADWPVSMGAVSCHAGLDSLLRRHSNGTHGGEQWRSCGQQ